jgi:hypothetical protein
LIMDLTFQLTVGKEKKGGGLAQTVRFK